MTLQDAGPEHRELLTRLLQLYLHDLSSIEEWELDDTGSFGDDDLDGCWTDARRHPFVIHADGHLAGFAIVDEGSDGRDDTDVYDMAEFFVARRWRRKGVGRAAARQLFRTFPGRWEVRPFPGYRPGESFWSQVCAEAATESVSQSPFDRGHRQGLMLAFDVG